MKTCTKCNEAKPVDGFYSRTLKRRDGTPYTYQEAQCKDCKRADTNARMQPEDKRQKSREYARGRCPVARLNERKLEAKIAGREHRTRAEISARSKAVAEIKAQAAKLKREREERARAERIAREPWRDRSLTEAERFAMRYSMDPEFNIKQKLRAALKRKRQGIRLAEMVRGAIVRNGKSPRAEAFLGYSVGALKQHMERQFTKGMTWEAFTAGRIHIDHRVPMSSFDLSNPEELQRAWAITNLQPLWAEANLAKGSRRELLV
jgi:hypothetical protein